MHTAAKRAKPLTPARLSGATGDINTGRKDAKRRTIWEGPRGATFVRVDGKKSKPAVGRTNGVPTATNANFGQLESLITRLMTQRQTKREVVLVTLNGVAVDVTVSIDPPVVESDDKSMRNTLGRRFNFQFSKARSNKYENGSDLYVAFLRDGVLYYSDPSKWSNNPESRVSRFHTHPLVRTFDKIYTDVIIKKILGRYGKPQSVTDIRKWQDTEIRKYTKSR